MSVTFVVLPTVSSLLHKTVLVTSIFTNIKNAHRFYATFDSEEYLKCYRILGISPGCDQDEVRVAFLEQVKKYHPDSGTPFANDEKFKEIEVAYRKLLKKFAAERWGTEEGAGEYGLYYKEEEKNLEFDIKHTAPQHRQYLSFDGHGSGTPQERQKQYQKLRAMNAIENVYKHRLSKLPQGEESSLLLQDKMHTKKNKISSEIHRLVEDLIQESMARGDFENLPGAGKPLPAKGSSPYVDFVTHKMNEVLIESGFVPEWITLQREITQTIQQVREELAEKRSCFGPLPLSDENKKWSHVLEEFQQQVGKLNKKINDFNLQVPLLDKQMMHFRLKHEANQILRNGTTNLNNSSNESSNEKVDNKGTPLNVFSMLAKIFRH